MDSKEFCSQERQKYCGLKPIHISRIQPAQIVPVFLALLLLNSEMVAFLTLALLAIIFPALAYPDLSPNERSDQKGVRIKLPPKQRNLGSLPIPGKDRFLLTRL